MAQSHCPFSSLQNQGKAVDTLYLYKLSVSSPQTVVHQMLLVHQLSVPLSQQRVSGVVIRATGEECTGPMPTTKHNPPASPDEYCTETTQPLDSQEEGELCTCRSQF